MLIHAITIKGSIQIKRLYKLIYKSYYDLLNQLPLQEECLPKVPASSVSERAEEICKLIKPSFSEILYSRAMHH